MDIPEGVCDNEQLEQIVVHLRAAEKRGVQVTVKGEVYLELPRAIRAMATDDEFAWNPVTIVDRHFIWFGMPASLADFTADGKTIESLYHPVIRFAGTYTAISLLSLLEMEANRRGRSLERIFGVKRG